jgi:hypothetical protein
LFESACSAAAAGSDTTAAVVVTKTSNNRAAGCMVGSPQKDYIFAKSSDELCQKE